MLPGWLYWNEGRKAHGVHDERAAIVHDIFVKAVEGWGQHKIAHWLNDRGVPTWGDASQWHRSYVKKILTNAAVIGTFTPHKKLVDNKGKRRRKPVATIENHFPAVVERELFDAVALKFATTAPRGRHANRPLRSLFSGVLRCSQCGATVSRVSKGEHVYLVCAKANSRAGTHPYQAVRYELVEKQFRRWAKGIIADAPRTNDTDLEEQIQRGRVNIDACEELTHELVDELVVNKSDAVRKRLQQAETELDRQRDVLRELLARRDALDPARVERRLQALLAALKRKPFDVAAANAVMKRAIRKIVINVRAGELQIQWHHVAEDAEPQVLPFPMFQRLPALNSIATQKRRRRQRRADGNSAAVA